MASVGSLIQSAGCGHIVHNESDISSKGTLKGVHSLLGPKNMSAIVSSLSPIFKTRVAMISTSCGADDKRYVHEAVVASRCYTPMDGQRRVVDRSHFRVSQPTFEASYCTCFLHIAFVF